MADVTSDPSAQVAPSPAPASSGGGLMGMLGGLLKSADPTFLMSMGAGLMSGARYGSNAGEGLLQGLSMYQQQKQGQMQQKLGQQQYQINDLNLQRQKGLMSMLPQLLGQGGAGPGAQGGAPAAAPPMGGAPPQANVAPQGMPGNPYPMSVPPSQAPQQPSQQPSYMTPPTAQDISGIPVNGVNPRLMGAYNVYQGKLPSEGAQQQLEAQRELAKQQFAPAMAQLQGVTQSDKPTRDVQASPVLQQTWNHYAAARGLDPQKDFTDANVRQVMGGVYNAYATQLGLPSSAPAVQKTQEKGPLGSLYERDPVTNELKQVRGEEPLKDVIGPGGTPVALPASAAAGRQPFNQITYGNAQMQGPAGALQAAMDARGVTLPGASGRNPAQMAQRLNNIMTANPGKSPEELTDMLRTGQLDYNGAKRSTGQLSTMAAATDVANKQLEKNFDSLAPLVAKNGLPKLNSWINTLQTNWKPGGDKEATEAQGYLLAIAGEYAKIRGGGTGAAAPAEGEQKEALKYMQGILTQGDFDGARTAIMQEAQNKRDSLYEGYRNAAGGLSSNAGPRGAVTPVPAKTVHWDDLK